MLRDLSPNAPYFKTKVWTSVGRSMAQIGLKVCIKPIFNLAEVNLNPTSQTRPSNSCLQMGLKMGRVRIVIRENLNSY